MIDSTMQFLKSYKNHDCLMINGRVAVQDSADVTAKTRPRCVPPLYSIAHVMLFIRVVKTPLHGLSLRAAIATYIVDAVDGLPGVI